MAKQVKTKPETLVRLPGRTIGDLEQLARITDRKAFWMPFANYADGFDRGVRTLRVLAEKHAHE